MLIVVSLFIAFGLNPVVEWLRRHGVRRSVAVLLVALGFIAALTIFVVALVPVIADQVAALTRSAPGLVRQAAAQPADPAARRPVRHRQQGPRLRHQRQDHPGRLRRRAGREPGDPRRAGQRVRGDHPDAVLPGLPGHGQARPLPPRPGQPPAARAGPRRPHPRRHRGLRLRRLPGGAVRGHLLDGLPVHRRARGVRRRSGPRGRRPRRDPDDRGDPGRGRGQRDRPGHRREDRHRLRDLLHRLPAGRELRDLSPGDVEVGGHPRLGHRDRGPDRRQPPRRRRRAAGHPHGRGDPAARARAVHATEDSR